MMGLEGAKTLNTQASRRQPIVSPAPQAADAAGQAAPLPQRLLATMADYAQQFLGASYDVLMGNIRKVCLRG